MAKIVYNDCYGGFGLSCQAVLRGREISGDPTWGGPCIIGDVWESGKPVDRDYGYVRNIERDDPTLVQVVEELGRNAGDRYADLKIAEVPSGQRYRIDEYDGLEQVMTPDDYDWKIAP